METEEMWIILAAAAISVSALLLLLLNSLHKTPLNKHFDFPSSISSEIRQNNNNLQRRLVLEILMSAGCPKSLQIKLEEADADSNLSPNPISNLAALTNLAASVSSSNRKWNLFRDLLKPPCDPIDEPAQAKTADSATDHVTESDDDGCGGLELEVKISAHDDVSEGLPRVPDDVAVCVPPRVSDWVVEAESVDVRRGGDGKSKRKKNRKKKGLQKKMEELGGFIMAKNAENNNDNEGELGCTCGIGKGDYHHGSCPYPFTSSASVIQRRIKLQYDDLVHSNASKSLTLAQVGRFTNCLVEAKAALQQKSETIQRKFTIAKSLLAKADKSTFDRLCGQIYRLETEQKRLEEDTVVYNRLQEQLKLSPAYQKMVEYGRTHIQTQQNTGQSEKSDVEDDEISFEELLAKEKKDSF
ncbi:hypothetical protein KI387_007123, partial [Taxus chinensis]